MSNLCAAASVLKRLKRPVPKDVQVGQFESEMVLEFPFELVRRFGNVRFDHTVVALRITEHGEPQPFAAFAVVSAGSFDPSAVHRGMRAAWPKAACELAEARATATFPATTATVSTTQLCVQTKDWEREPRVELARQLLSAPAQGALLRVLMPAGSRLLPLLEQAGFAGVASAEATFAIGERLELDIVLRLPDAEVAEKVVAQGKQQWAGWLANPMLVPDLDVKADGASVHAVVSVPRAKLPAFADARKKVIELSR